MPANNDQYLPGQEVVPGYTLIRQLGGGMAGDVWEARAAGGTHVAVKIVRSLSMLGGQKELKALRTIRDIRHPNLCPVHGFWTKDAEGRLLEDGETEANLPDSSVSIETKLSASSGTDTMAITQLPDHELPTQLPDHELPESKHRKAEQLIVVMGLGDRTLHDRLAEARIEAGLVTANNDNLVGGLDAAEAIGYLRAAASAIDELNQRHSIYHCDIKPKNILLVGSGVQVCDFGLANRIEGDIRKTRQAFATPAYGAPEVLSGSTYSRTVDQYSLAVTYYELCTGTLPFDAATEMSMLLAKGRGDFDLQDVSPPERKVLQRALDVDPEKRFATCTDFIDALAIASGVDKPSGITPAKLAIAVSVLAALLGTGTLVWKFVHPESFYSVFSPGEAARNFGLAEAQVAPLVMIQAKGSPLNFRDSGAISTAIGKTVEAYAAGPSGELEVKMQAFIGHWSGALVTVVSRRLDELATYDWRQVQNHPPDDHTDEPNKNLPKWAQDDATGIRNYLTTLRRIFDTNRWSLADPEFATLRGSVARANIQLDLITGAELNSESLAILRQQIATSKSSLIDVVTIALIHAAPEADYTSDRSLQDIVRAQTQLTAVNQNDLPDWCRNRWLTMETEFLEQFKSYCESKPSTDPVVKTIRTTWPDLVIDANLNKLRQLIATGRWEDFNSLMKLLSDDVAAKTGLGEEDQLRIEVFQHMHEALEAPREADQKFEKVGRKLISDPDQPSLVTEFRPSIDAWVHEIANRLLTDTDQVPFEIATKIYRAGDLLDPVNRDEVNSGGRSALQKLLMVAAIQSGRDSMDNESVRAVLETALRDDASPNSLLQAAILLELQPRDSQITARVIAGLKNKLMIEQLISLTSPAYLDYLRLVAQFASHKDDSDIWKKFEPDSESAEQLRASLLPERRCRVAEMFLDLATVESGVPDDEVLRLRFAGDNRGQSRVEQAKWWINSSLDMKTDVYHKFQMHVLIAEFAKQKGQIESTQGPVRLKHFLKVFPSDAEAQPSNGQFYRAAYEFARAQYESQQGNADPAAVALMVKSAVFMCQIGLKSEVTDPQFWIDVVLEPTMSVLQASDTSSNEPRLIIEFCDHYLKTEGIYTEKNSDEARRLTRLEFASARLATDKDASDSRRFFHWLQASEFLQESVEKSLADWNEADVRRFRRYVESAAQILPDDPKVVVQLAFADYFDATMQRATSTRSERLGKAGAKLDGAIQKLEESNDSSEEMLSAQYNVYWRHANTLVSLAFDQELPEKKDTLVRAHESATKAIGLLSSNQIRRQIDKNRCYMVLGNTCEDLAFYCKLPEQEQTTYFNQAIEAFETAVGLTTTSAKARYSLARCRFRHWVLSKHKNAGELNQAQADLGAEPTDDEPTPIKAEWFVWRAVIKEELKERDQALRDMETAYKLVISDRSNVSDLTKNETLRLYARMLSEGDNQQTEQAIRLLADKVLPGDWPSIDLHCKLLYARGRYADLIATIDAIREDAFEKLDRHPKDVAEHLAALSCYVRLVGEDQSFKAKAAACLERLQQRVGQFQSKADESLIAHAYLGFLEANAVSLRSNSLTKRFEAYGVAFEQIGTTELKPDILREVRIAVLDQFIYAVRDKKLEQIIVAREALGPLLRKVLTHEVGMLGRDARGLNDNQRNAVAPFQQAFR